MSTTSQCPECGAPLGNDLAAGMCARCLAREGLAILEGSTVVLEPSMARAGPASAGAPADLSESSRRFGDYELLGEIGHGGMGVVRHARQISLNRPVALKMIRSGGLATAAEVQRFRTEAEAAAQLDHPNIVPIYDIGEQHGQHFFTMKLVEGGSLAEAIDGRPMPARRAARMLAKIARAVHFAHQRGILHRDLKPTNILLDAQDEPQLTDFGLAKFIERDTGPTHSVEVMGSASYMSPEQAGGQAKQLTTASDLYSLGAVLYEMLTGEPPFRGDSFVDTLRQVADREPTRPSVLNPKLDRDLETICLKCLEKHPSHRYPSAELLALDLERWLAGETILARPSTTWTRTVKWVRRKPAVASLTALLLLVALAGLGGILWQWHQTKATARALRRNLYAADINLAQRALAENNLGRAVELLRKCRPEPGEEDLRGFEWRYLWQLTQGSELATFLHDEFVEAVAFSPDGRLLASLGRDHAVRVWDALSRQALTNLAAVKVTATRGATVGFSPDGRFLVASPGPREGGNPLWVWNTDSWQQVAQLPEVNPPVFFHPDSGSLVGQVSNQLVRWNTSTWLARPDGTFPGLAHLRALSSDGRTALTGSLDETLFQVWDLAGAKRLGEFSAEAPLNTDNTVAFAISSDARWVATASWRGLVRLWSAREGREAGRWLAHGSPIYGLAFSPDGRRLATGGFDQVAHLWDLATLQKLATLRGHFSELWSVAFSPDGRWLASAGKDSSVKLWSTEPKSEDNTLTNAIVPLGWMANGTQIAALQTNRTIGVWNLSTRREVRTFTLGLDDLRQASALALAPDGQSLALGTERGELLVCRLTQPPATNRWSAHGGLVAWIEFSQDGRLLATASRTSVRLWDLASARQLLRLEGAGKLVVLSPDARRLLAAGPDFTGLLYDLPTGRLVATLPGHKWQIWSACFTPDSRRVLTASTDATVRVWDASNGALLAVLTGHKEGVTFAAITPDGRTLATGSTDDTVKLWSLETYQEMVTLPDFGEDVGLLMFSPDGSSLVVGSMPGSGGRGYAQVWRAPTLSEIHTRDLRRRLVR